MDKHFGLNFLLRTYLGIASNVVQPHEREERKSIGAERSVFINVMIIQSDLSQNILSFERCNEDSTEAGGSGSGA
jgi:DNA polymerase kappa